MINDHGWLKLHASALIVRIVVTFVHDVPTALEVHLLEARAESTKVEQSQVANVKTALKMIM